MRPSQLQDGDAQTKGLTSRQREQIFQQNKIPESLSHFGFSLLLQFFHVVRVFDSTARKNRFTDFFRDVFSRQSLRLNPSLEDSDSEGDGVIGLDAEAPALPLVEECASFLRNPDFRVRWGFVFPKPLPNSQINIDPKGFLILAIAMLEVRFTHPGCTPKSRGFWCFCVSIPKHKKKKVLRVCQDNDAGPANAAGDSEAKETLQALPNHVLVALHLHEWKSKAHSETALASLGKELGLKSVSHLRDVLRSNSRMLQLAQLQLSEALGGYIVKLIDAGAWQPIALVHRVAYDETPLKLASLTVGSRDSVTTVSKLFVVHSSWCALLRTPSGKEISFHGSWSPLLRTAESTAGECVAQIVSTAPAPSIEIQAAFKGKCIRCVETDEGPGNSRGERLLKLKPDSPGPWLLWHSYCSAHKVHLMSESTWELSRPVLQGVLRTLLLFSSADNFLKLCDTLESEIPAMCQVVYHDLSHEAETFRSNTLKTFMPRQPMRKSYVLTICARLLNSDWRVQGVLLHRCGPRCCRSRDDTIRKMVRHLGKLLRLLKPSTLCRGNWTNWDAPLPFIGLLTALHGLLPFLFKKAFAEDEVCVCQ